MSESLSQKRTLNYIKQVKASFIFRLLAVIASFFSVPLMLSYLGLEKFGVWSTLLSIMTWLVFFDMGVGNGMRNKIAETMARGDLSESIRYISTGYALIGVISTLMFALLASVAFFIPWQAVFNTTTINEEVLRKMVHIVSFFICLNLVVSLVAQVLNALQKTSVVIFSQFMTNSFALIFVIILIKTTESSLVYLSVSHGVSLLLSNLIISFFLYRKRSDLAPRFDAIDVRYVRSLASLSLKFFILQAAVLVIFTTDKIVITQLFGPQYVAQYDVAFKVFSVITLVQALIVAPLWSSYTDAYHRGDFSWLKDALAKQLMIFMVIVIATIVLAFMAQPIVSVWIGREFEMPVMLVLSMAIFTVVTTWNSVFSSFLNGIQKIKVSYYVSFVAMFFNIPISIYLAQNTSLGASSVVYGTVISLLPGVVLGPYQTSKILRKTEVGIWAR